jgi:tRNA U34 5-methylaminomethyl-2-thiouridine-forming methyltransferase MnmC
MCVKRKIELTADGSHTLFVPELDEHYHSVNGAVQESTHIFINAGLHNYTKKQINILEIGFGTGLNAFLTLLDIQQSDKKIHYTTLEAYPLSEELVEQLNYPEQINPAKAHLYYKIHEVDWNKDIEITANFTIRKVETDFTAYNFIDINNIDIVYFDAFAPEKQPDMWTQELFDKLYSIMNEGSILVTYCAKGVVRRMLQQSGFTVERLPGPPGKREILRGKK